MAADKLEDNYSLTAAIDFGTTFSGYGFSRQDKINSVTVNKEWKTEVYKTPTTVLINDKGEFVSFGFDAETQYSQLTKEELQNHNLFKHFKMMLYHVKNLTRSTTINSVTGRSHRALDIFAMSLRFLKGHLLDQVKFHDGSVPQNADIRWVLTIPAIWNDKAKQFMREAALEAELITSKESKQLVLALEPEAASVVFRHLEVNHYIGAMEKEMKTSLYPGTRYMTIDAGGGTIDITVHKILEEGKIEELIPATGGDWGGNEINRLFEELLCDILNKDFINDYKRCNPKSWLLLQNTFEKAKREVSTYQKMRVHLPFGIDSAYSKFTNDDIIQVLDEASSSFGVCFSEGCIVLEQKCVQKLFDSVITQTVDRVKEILKSGDVGKLKYIILAGGFGESKILYNRLNEEFKESSTIISPVSAGLSIIKGAVLFAYNPSSIKVRRMRKTYGYGVDMLFQEDEHEEDRKYIGETGKVWCSGCFETFVKKYESVELNSLKTFSTSPKRNTSVSCCFQMYSSDSVDVMYTDDTRLSKVGELNFDLPPVPLEEEDTRESEIRVKFGGTEIEVEICTKTANGTDTKALSIDYFKD